MAKTASHLTVYIRTASISLSMRQRNLTKEEQDQNKSIYKSIFNLARQTTSGIAFDAQEGMLSDATIRERERLWEELWNRGGFNFQLSNYTDYIWNMESNKLMYDFWKRKTRPRIKNPEKRAFLAPEEPPFVFGTKRSSLEQDYYECMDLDTVDVVDLKANPIREFTERGIICDDGKERDFDIVILATGYDSMTGSLTNMGLRGKEGLDIKERWKDGVSTHLGMFMSGCPNLLIIYGPQGRSHLS
jgi:cation diffusion facilitator CzcD-associated flavoprotein CzcO